MVFDRKRGLKRNFRLMFFIQALTEIKAINAIVTIFYLHRGLTLSQVFCLGVVFALVSIVTEVPSSYLADKWSRKGLIITALIFGIIYWVFNLFARGFGLFIIANSLYAITYSIMSGTDEALVYDSAKELGEESTSLKKLGQFYSGQRIFKIITPLIAVIMARNLTDWQFNSIISIDILGNFIALILSLYLIEPKHQFLVEKIESGVMRDAINLLKHNRLLLTTIINRSVIFIAGFTIWRIGSEYFNELGVPIIFIGLITAINQLTIFIFNLNTDHWFSRFNSSQIINALNFTNLLAIALFTINHLFFHNLFFAMLVYFIVLSSETIRWPYFSDLFNQQSHSYNRATTLSLSNLLNSFLQIPLLFLSSVMIGVSYTYLFIMVFTLALAINLFFPTKVNPSTPKC